MTYKVRLIPAYGRTGKPAGYQISSQLDIRKIPNSETGIRKPDGYLAGYRISG